jgi:hypothetical protein
VARTGPERTAHLEQTEMADEKADGLESRLNALQEELRLLKETVLPMLIEIRERLLRRDEA